MKKIVSRSAVTILSMITFVSCTLSQEIVLHQNRVGMATAVPESKDQSTEIRYINNVNGKVLKSFHRSFGEKPDAKWSKTENGFVVHFTDSSMSTNVYFRSNGAIEYRVNYYFEDQLPRSVRHTVKSNFYDYSIIQVSEVHKDGSVCYFVKVEDKVSINTIRVIGQDWELVEHITKQLSPASEAKNGL